MYVLDKDNDLNIAQLARQNASDIVKVQPEGPYLLGGHSYGGAVAMEVAMVLESWGHDIGAVLVRFARCVVVSHGPNFPSLQGLPFPDCTCTGKARKSCLRLHFSQKTLHLCTVLKTGYYF